MFGGLLEVEMSNKCTPLCREAHLEVKMLQKTRGSDHFWTIPWRFDVEKVYAVVARSTLGGSTYPKTGGFGLLCDDSIVMRGEEEEEEQQQR